MSKLIENTGNQSIVKKLRGGKRVGAGRPLNWFKKMCEQEFIGHKGKAVLELGKIARGELEVEKIFVTEGSIIRANTRVTPSYMVQAASFLADRAFGKAHQSTDITSDGRSLLDILKEVHGDA